MNKKVFVALLILGVISVSFSILFYFDLISFNNLLFFKQSSSKSLIPQQTNQEETATSTPAFFTPEEETIDTDYIKSPEPEGYVTDLAKFLNNEEKEEITKIIKNYKEETSNEFVVLTVKSLGDEKIEDYTTRVFNEWGVGSPDKNNGILFLITFGQIRIGIGYDLESKFTEEIIEEAINENLALFKEKEYVLGIIGIIDVLKKYE
jgi:uncharacterized membrane protein YgcG